MHEKDNIFTEAFFFNIYDMKSTQEKHLHLPDTLKICLHLEKNKDYEKHGNIL